MAYRPAARSSAHQLPMPAPLPAPLPHAAESACDAAPDDPWRRLALHGHGIELSVDEPTVRRAVDAIFRGLIEPSLPGEPAVRGTVVRFEEHDVLRRLSPEAVRVNDPELPFELYREPRGGERLWLVDERWGLCEINLLRRTWRSSILENPSIDDMRLFEAAIMWPMAQLLRGTGLHLIPAAAIGRGGRGMLILSPFDVGPEVAALAEAGVGVIGQRWVALREESDGRIALLSVPGRTERTPAPRLLSAGPMGQATWVDLAFGRACHHAYCDSVLLVEPMRRSQTHMQSLSAIEARDQLKHVWPIPQLSGGLSPTVAMNKLAANLARSCSVERVCLGRSGADFARFLVRGANGVVWKRPASTAHVKSALFAP